MSDEIIIRGARTHNLKNIDCAIPHGKLTVVSGVSGSGKSSLAFDTIYAEGQRRYVESLSAYARQFLERMEKPDVDLIDGLAPAIAIRQKNSTRNPRSTVATATEIYDYMRLLWARCGVVHCTVCGGVVRRDTVDEIVATILTLGEGTRLHALFPVQPLAAAPVSPAGDGKSAPAKSPRRTRKAAPAAAEATKDGPQSGLSDALHERLFDLRRRGFNRLYQNGAIYEFSTPESLLEIDFALPVYVLVDRIVISPENRARIVDAAEIGYRESGEILFELVRRGEPFSPVILSEASAGNAVEGPAFSATRFSAAFECKTCYRVYREPEPSLFSFNNPFGACPRCQGFGNTIDFDLDLIIPDKTKALDEGAIDPWNRPKYRSYLTELRRAARQNGIPLDVPWWDLTPEQQSFVLDGCGSFPGVHGFFALLERRKYKLHVRVMLSKYRGYALCPDCKGQRLRAEARAVSIAEKNICEAASLTIGAAAQFFSSLRLTPMQEEIAGSILEEIRQRLHFLDAVGLDYLTLDRLASTLSGGESQRIQLATSLGSRLVGALYVLDEPSIGLHPRDTARLIRILDELRDLGNTILVVEHDPDVLRAADYLLDLGPGAGEFGGKVLAAGSIAEVSENPASITGRYLSGHLTIPVPSRRKTPGSARDWLRLRGARAHNLKGIDVDIPLNLLVCITGVSGSGKSTLVHDVLYKAVSHALGRIEGGDPTGVYRDLRGAERLNDIVLVDQTPIGRTPRSNPVTYIKAFDAIRELFAAQPEAQRRGYTPGHFSFNVPGGRCDVCEGDGTVTVEMQFLADVELPCDECNGTRYKASTLEIHYKNRSIHEVLQMTVREALRFFTGHPKIVDKLAVLEEIGLGYVRLGQSATTLSGGEAQRVKLAAHLAFTRSAERGSGDGKRGGSRVLYILDEPTTGLHFDDVGKLLVALRKLIDSGGSLVVIEHNLDVIKSADWVIDLGPEGGAAGGQIVVAGTPEDVAGNELSHTGQWLARILQGHAASHSTPAIESEVVL
ncbi:MAG TPA: excinuclease ABC subunit UvrA [Acidobacteriaceae bacterium]|nr:excinuclease ABC subunit UvrA [Acidobacteriaceae bacterium]